MIQKVSLIITDSRIVVSAKSVIFISPYFTKHQRHSFITIVFCRTHLLLSFQTVILIIHGISSENMLQSIVRY